MSIEMHPVDLRGSRCVLIGLTLPLCCGPCFMMRALGVRFRFSSGPGLAVPGHDQPRDTEIDREHCRSHEDAVQDVPPKAHGHDSGPNAVVSEQPERNDEELEGADEELKQTGVRTSRSGPRGRRARGFRPRRREGFSCRASPSSVVVREG